MFRVYIWELFVFYWSDVAHHIFLYFTGFVVTFSRLLSQKIFKICKIFITHTVQVSKTNTLSNKCTSCFNVYNTKIPTCFDTQVPSPGNYYKKCARANLLIYVLFIFIILIKTSVVKVHKTVYIC
jgi:hypothetical protein